MQKRNFKRGTVNFWFMISYHLDLYGILFMLPSMAAQEIMVAAVPAT
jgi:hypothetical protein